MLLILIWVIIAFLQYLQERKAFWLLLGSLFAGLDLPHSTKRYLRRRSVSRCFIFS